MTQKKTGFHYGWVMAFVGMLAMFFAAGAVSTAFSTISAYIKEVWGISHTESSMLITVRTAGSIVAVALSGIYFKKIPIRWGLGLAMVMGAVGFAMLLPQNLMIGYVGMFIMGCCRGFGGTVGVAILVNNWFKKYRGTVLSACSLGSGFTSAIFPVLITGIVEKYDLNAALLAISVVFCVIGALCFLLARQSPEEMGLERVGEHEEVNEEKKTIKLADEKYDPSNFHCILMMIACFLVAAFTYTQGSFRTIHLTTLGWDKTTAAVAVSFYGLWVTLGKIPYGPLCDKFSMRKLNIIFVSMSVLTHVCYAFCGDSVLMANIAGILYGLSGPICTIGLQLFGFELAKGGDTVTWIKNYSLIYNIGGLIWTPLTGVIADITGDYSAAYLMYAVCAAIALVLIQISYNGAHKRALANEAVAAE